MINEKDIRITRPSSTPTEGPWIVTDSGKVVSANFHNEALEWICDIQTAPNGGQANQAIICAASLMFRALKLLQRDPKFNKLDRNVVEAVNEALTAAE